MELRIEAARGCHRRLLPAAIRVYHTHLDSEDGVDGLFDAREVSLANGSQHLILADAHQGLLRGRDDTTAAAVLRCIRTRHFVLRVIIASTVLLQSRLLKNPGVWISRASGEGISRVLSPRRSGPREIRSDTDDTRLA